MYGGNFRPYDAIAMAGVKATGSITCVAKASFLDGETLTIGDGTQAATIFEFDTDGGGVAGGHTQVDISGATSAADVAALLVTAINGVTTGLLITAVDAGAGVVTLSADSIGDTANVTITETVAAAGFLVSGMSGGTSNTVYGTPTNMEGKKSYGAQGVWTGSPTGTITFEASDDYDRDRATGNWNAFTMTAAGTSPAGSASSSLYSAIDFPHKWIRPKYVRGNATAGVLTMTAVAK